ncbi:hypothetical protein MKS88_004345 [Plasmodium brasilianum]|uniref:Uncharacterized protein n=1 Tax=Plasmodium brasilianum TaxID=5824 RepID=A0ACB9Y5D6_PLABR|nr:hypothetical protein MKS88_004345 [Plasmodium brasilianum]
MLSTFPSNKLSDVFLSPTDEEDLKASMKRYAGDRFIKDYENLLNEKSTDSKRILAKSMINLIKQQFIKLKEIEAQYVTPNFEQYKQIIELKPQILDLDADTPCNTEAECKKLENMMNICTYVRGGADFAYDIFLVTTHVVNSMIAVLCACIFIGPVHVCALKNFPYTCKLPYPVFSTLFMATSAVWEVICPLCQKWEEKNKKKEKIEKNNNKDKNKNYNKDKNKNYNIDKNKNYNKDKNKDYNKDKNKDYNKDKNKDYNKDKNKDYDKDKNEDKIKN